MANLAATTPVLAAPKHPLLKTGGESSNAYLIYIQYITYIEIIYLLDNLFLVFYEFGYEEVLAEGDY